MYILFYKPPCGKWYVHSHKLYDTPLQADDAAKRFLAQGTPYAVLPVDVEELDEYCSSTTEGA